MIRLHNAALANSEFEDLNLSGSRFE
ncbi:MAG: pentapeptide repeat-containing protein, partial [Rhizobiaceae bacterium]